MLGKRVVQEAERRGHIVEDSDIRFGTDFSWSLFSESDTIINCAGSISFKKDPADTIVTANTLGPWQLTLAAKSWGCRLVHMSTDAVYSGLPDTLHPRRKLPDPIDLYGKSKLAGEPQGKNVVVVRGSFIGPDHGFFKWAVEATGSIQAWTKVTWNGGSVQAMARELVNLAEGNEEGVFNVAAEDPVTKAWMIEYIIENLDSQIETINLVDKPIVKRDLIPDIFLPSVKDSLDELIAEVNES